MLKCGFTSVGLVERRLGDHCEIVAAAMDADENDVRGLFDRAVVVVVEQPSP